MSNTSSVRSYRDLIVWQRAMMLVEECYRVTAQLPTRECYGLAAQIRRSAASVPANIAEGHGSVHRRQYMRYVMIAQGSVRELETHLEITVRVRLLEGQMVANAIRLCAETGRMLRSLHAALARIPAQRPPSGSPRPGSPGLHSDEKTAAGKGLSTT